MKIFENEELNSMANRSLTLLQSLSNLGLYFENTGIFNKTAIQTEVGLRISEQDYKLALRAIEVLDDIVPKARRNPAAKDYYHDVRERIVEAQKKELKKPGRKKEWLLKIVVKNLFRVLKHSLQKSLN